MSEYQYYGFRAVDRPLTSAEMKRLRRVSTRAEITPVSFTNHYEWGDFKGDPTKLMWQYFDAFLYLANWGTRQLKLRVAASLIDVSAAEPYCGEAVSVSVKGKHALLEFDSDEEAGEWEESGEGLLTEMLPLRDAIIAGDLRPLYVGWLAGVQEGLVEDDAPEPPVPPGLGRPSAALEAMIEFLRIRKDLFAVAAQASPQAQASPGPSRRELAARIASLPEPERNALLVDLVEGDAAAARKNLLGRIRKMGGPAVPTRAVTGRTVGELLATADAREEGRLRKAAERVSRERARLEAEEAARRAKYLNELSRRAEAAWNLVESKVESKQQANYDEAVELLRDLREVSARDGGIRSFESRVRLLQQRHVKKITFAERLQKARLLKWGGVG